MFLLPDKESNIVQGHGEYPCRVVIHQVLEPSIESRPYATHVQVLPEGKDAFFVMGHYDMSFTEALADYHERVRDNESGRKVVEQAKAHNDDVFCDYCGKVRDAKNLYQQYGEPEKAVCSWCRARQAGYF